MDTRHCQMQPFAGSSASAQGPTFAPATQTSLLEQKQQQQLQPVRAKGRTGAQLALSTLLLLYIQQPCWYTRACMQQHMQHNLGIMVLGRQSAWDCEEA